MSHEIRPLVDITHEALHLLYRELGPVNTLRFLNQFTTGHGNYTEEREELFGNLSLDEIVAAIKEEKRQASPGKPTS